MSDHAKFVEIATRLIAKHGRTVVIKGISATPTDSDKPWKGSGGTLTTLATTIGVFVPHKGLEFGSDFVEEELLRQTEQLCLVSGGEGDFDNARIITDTVDYKIAWVKRLKPGDTVILYAFGISR